MCYATRYDKPNRKKISPAGLSRIWKQAEHLGAFMSALEGGEPVLHPQFFDMLAALKPFSNVVVLVSNAIALNRDYIKELKKNGLSVLHLSLNSADPKTNDVIRGFQGQFAQVMASVEYAKEFNIPVYFSSVLDHHNKEDFLKIIDLAEQLKIGVSGALLVSMGRYSEQRQLRPTLQDREWLLNLLKKKGHILRFDWSNNFSNRYECPAGYEKIAISVYGEVMSCVCNHLSFGNALEEPLADICQRMRDFSLFKERNPLCLASFDTTYLREYLDPIADSPTYPVSIFQHPKHPAKLINGRMMESEL
jgi:MoaA/NifB/PqqE/SkfB family radical SAM enzyme